MTNMIAFLSPADSLAQAYATHYNPWLVAVSVGIAAFASFAAFQVAERLRTADSAPAKIFWQGIGGLAMGGGVWSMHFIGMLALKLPHAVFYDPAVTLLSMIPGIFASAAALNVMKQRRPSPGSLTLGGLLMGGGIGAMHYSGMAAMRLDGAIRYDPALFALSLVVAAVLAAAALYTKFLVDARFVARSHALSNGAGAVLMGAAIAGMHYTAMLAANFLPNGTPPAGDMVLNPVTMAVTLGFATVMITALVFAAALLGRHLDTITQLRRVVAERVKAEGEARKFLRAVEQSSAAILITDARGNIEYANPRFADVTGYAPDEVCGKKLDVLKSGEIDDTVYADLWATIRAGREWRGELLNRRKNGDFYWDRTLIAPIRNGDGEIANFLAVKEDVTERKAMEKALIEAKELAEAGNRVKTAFLANISHQLRTPLTAVIRLAEIMVGGTMGPLPRAYQEYAAKILSGGRQELAIIGDLLDMARIEAGKMPFQEEVVSLGAAVRDAFIIVEPQARKKNLTLGEDCPDRYRLRGDSQHLLRILVNLLANAVEHTESGTVKVRSFLEQGRVRLTVEDSGAGMSAEQVRDALEPFSRIEENPATPSGTGAGLGLPMVQQLLKLYQAEMAITAAPGRGTTIAIRFPAARTVMGA